MTKIYKKTQSTNTIGKVIVATVLGVMLLGISTPAFAYGGCNSCRVYGNDFYNRNSYYINYHINYNNGDYYNRGRSSYGVYGHYYGRGYGHYYGRGYGHYYGRGYSDYGVYGHYSGYSSGHTTRNIITGMAVGAVVCYFWCN